MLKKICTKCGETKLVREFSKDKSRKDGYRFHCKACVKQYYEANRDHLLEYQKHYYEANRDRACEYQKHYQRANKDADAAKSARRRALKLDQTPDLTMEEQTLIDRYYSMCKFLGTDKYHVDHIIPLAKGGLHHPDNLQILSAEDNLSKHDRINYDYKHPRIRITEHPSRG